MSQMEWGSIHLNPRVDLLQTLIEKLARFAAGTIANESLGPRRFCGRPVDIIRRLRKALKQDGQPDLIRTVRGAKLRSMLTGLGNLVFGQKHLMVLF